MTQFIVFSRCVLVGAASAGAVGFAAFPLRFFTRGGAVFYAFFDFLTFLVLTTLFMFCSAFFDFGSPRGYMAAGAVVGIIIYRKSFQISLDFCSDKVYNGIWKRLNQRKIHAQKPYGIK